MTAPIHIDVGAILHTSHNGISTNLVTRATGRTVRAQIEACLEATDPGTVSIIDFSNVGVLDFSCADEIIATLMRQCCDDRTASDRYVLFAGITDEHLDAIEHVLERHGLALVVRFTGLGAIRLVGVVLQAERDVWEAVSHLTSATVDVIVDMTGFARDVVRESLESLHRQRLLMRRGGEYIAPRGVVA